MIKLFLYFQKQIFLKVFRYYNNIWIFQNNLFNHLLSILERIIWLWFLLKALYLSDISRLSKSLIELLFNFDT